MGKVDERVRAIPNVQSDAPIARAMLAPPVAPISMRPDRSRSSGAAEERDWVAVGLVAAAVGCWLALVVAFALDHLTAAPHSLVVGLYVVAYLSGGSLAAVAAVRDLLARHVNVDLLMVAAALGAATVDAWAEGAVLLALFSTSNALEHLALGRTRKAVRALMDLSPPVATVVRPEAPGGEAVVPVAELRIDDVVIVRPGERLPVDGVVIAGASSVDQSAVTGESLPVAKNPGSGVFAGTINGTGVLRVRVTKLAAESTVAKIVQLVEAAQAEKSRAQRFTDAFEGRYAVGVIVASALIAVLPPLITGAAWDSSFYRAMTLLVVASPCALVISTPAATLSALANAARRGILIKGARHLEELGTVETVAFDKTGTLTRARLGLTDLRLLDGDGAWDEPTLLRLAASAEHDSEHPLAAAIVAAARERGLDLLAPLGFRAYPGRGVVAQLPPDESGRAREIAAGNETLFADLGIPIPPAATAALTELTAQAKKTILVGEVGPGGKGGAVRGVLAFADAIRPEAAAAVRELRRLGVRRVVMLTGDHEAVAAVVAAETDIDEYRASLLPDQKVEFVRELLRDGSVMMVGDGINDAPALATATVGAAMGAAGSDVALETADVVLMSDDLGTLTEAIALSRRTRRIIRQNLTFSLAVIVVLVTAALTIGIPLPLGVVGHEGSTVIVVLNGLRLLGGARS